MSEKRRDGDFLGDIREALENISLYVKGFTLQSFLEDRKTQDAVVRNFEVLGEAAKNISRDFKARHPEVPWRKLAGLRDKLAHFYFGIDYNIVWNVAKKELPKVLKRIKEILNHEAD